MSTPITIGLIIVAATLAPVPATSAQVHNVTQDTLHATIQEAIDTSTTGDEIEVGPGTYVERIDLLGKAITLRSTDGEAVTIIDADSNGTVVTCQNGEGADTVIEGFTITNGYSTGLGGGMFNDSSSPTLINCTFTGNSASLWGGGMANAIGSSPTLINCTFTENTADSGGGIHNFRSSLTMTGCILGENTATSGGGIENNQSSLTATSCIFAGNSADSGGGMTNIESSPTVTNCTFSGNTANGGAGMINATNSSPTITNCTFCENTSTFGGGMMTDGMNANPKVTNCIFWGNVARYGPQLLSSTDSTMTVIYSCIQEGWPGAGNIDADPLFIDANGPDDMPGTPDDDLRLQPGSPCIDAGMSVAIDFDLDGNPRIVDDPDTVDTGIGFPEVIDMGAYEYQGGAPLPGDFDEDGAITLADYDVFEMCLWFSGPGTNTAFEECAQVFDFDDDDDIDLHDFAAFQVAFTGL